MSKWSISDEQVKLSGTNVVDDLVAASAPARLVKPSYVPTRIAFVDSLLALADQVTNGKAGVLQRATSYLIVGGFAAVVNLACLTLFYNVWSMPFPRPVHYVVAFVLASEISIMANFIPNDRITFSRLPGHGRSWWARCLRFHSTCIVGTIITFVISISLHLYVGLAALYAQAIAIIVALIFNFTFHHLWTYRHVAPHSAA
jgi:putative flippase GtrA